MKLHSLEDSAFYDIKRKYQLGPTTQKNPTAMKNKCTDYYNDQWRSSETCLDFPVS